MSVCLDSWAVLAWLMDEEPAASRLDAVIDTRPVISWINLAEVYYRLERVHDRRTADETVADLRGRLRPDLPGSARVLEAARLKARNTIALADCFALATAAAHGLTLWTGDPEIVDLANAPCPVQDLRS